MKNLYLLLPVLFILSCQKDTLPLNAEVFIGTWHVEYNRYFCGSSSDPNNYIEECEFRPNSSYTYKFTINDDGTCYTISSSNGFRQDFMWAYNESTTTLFMYEIGGLGINYKNLIKVVDYDQNNIFSSSITSTNPANPVVWSSVSEYILTRI